jgi:hypothetical protein
MRQDQNILTFEGNARNIVFRLRKKGQRDFFDVSTATKIQMELDDPEGDELAPIEADSGHSDADWSQGRVVVEITPGNLTANVGTYAYALTVFIGAEIVTAAAGHVEVAERPGYPAPP